MALIGKLSRTYQTMRRTLHANVLNRPCSPSIHSVVMNFSIKFYMWTDDNRCKYPPAGGPSCPGEADWLTASCL